MYLRRNPCWACSHRQDHSRCRVPWEAALTEIRHASFFLLVRGIWHEGRYDPMLQPQGVGRGIQVSESQVSVSLCCRLHPTGFCLTFLHSHFSPVPRNTAIWHEFYEEIQPAVDVPLVSLTACWLYNTNGQDQEVPPSPLTNNSDLFSANLEPAAVDGGIRSSLLVVPRATIRTSFDLEQEAHGRMPLGISGDAYVWTEAERARAKLSKNPKTLEELEAEVWSAFKGPVYG